jgi:hypothetical protein
MFSLIDILIQIGQIIYGFFETVIILIYFKCGFVIFKRFVT